MMVRTAKRDLPSSAGGWPRAGRVQIQKVREKAARATSRRSPYVLRRRAAIRSSRSTTGKKRIGRSVYPAQCGEPKQKMIWAHPEGTLQPKRGADGRHGFA